MFTTDVHSALLCPAFVTAEIAWHVPHAFSTASFPAPSGNAGAVCACAQTPLPSAILNPTKTRNLATAAIRNLTGLDSLMTTSQFLSPPSLTYAHSPSRATEHPARMRVRPCRGGFTPPPASASSLLIPFRLVAAP